MKNYEGLIQQPNSAYYIIQNIDRAEKAQGWPFEEIFPNLRQKKVLLSAPNTDENERMYFQEYE